MAVKATFSTPGGALGILTQGFVRFAKGYTLEADTTNAVVYGPELEFTGTSAGGGGTNTTLEDESTRLEGC